MPKVLPLLLKIILVLGAVWALFVLLVWRFQERLAFPGPHTPVPDPTRLGAPDGQIVTVQTSDGVTLKGWYLPPSPPPPPGERAPGLLWFYGNMETVATVGLILHATGLRPPGTGLLVLDYRGYGESGGTTNEAGLYRDGDAAWQFMRGRPEIDSTRIAVYGRSLGSAVALYVATAHPVRAVVLDSPFSSAADMAARHYRFVPRALLRLKMNNVDRARRLTAPLLVFHGSDDRIAPIRMGRAVAEAGRAQDVVEIVGAGHNDTYEIGDSLYRDRMLEFLSGVLAAHP